MLESVIYALLSVWIVATVIAQFSFPVGRRLAATGILPIWTFFAPSPGTFDFHVLYRLEEFGTIGNWRELHAHESRSLTSALWNPKKREAKALFDVCVALSNAVVADPASVQVSLPYIAILRAAAHTQSSSHAESIQFMIMQREKGQSSVLFLSASHPL